MCVSINGKDTICHGFLHDPLNGFRSTKTTSMSSNFDLFVIIVIMNSSSSTITLICFILLKWQVWGEENILLKSSTMVETQYLTFDMAQYGLARDLFSSMSHSSFVARFHFYFSF